MNIYQMLDMASDAFDRVVSCSIPAGMVILIVLTIRYVAGRRLTGRWLHLLWLIAMLRLALPWVPETRFNPLGGNLRFLLDWIIQRTFGRQLIL